MIQDTATYFVACILWFLMNHVMPEHGKMHMMHDTRYFPIHKIIEPAALTRSIAVHTRCT